MSPPPTHAHAHVYVHTLAAANTQMSTQALCPNVGERSCLRATVQILYCMYNYAHY